MSFGATSGHKPLPPGVGVSLSGPLPPTQGSTALTFAGRGGAGPAGMGNGQATPLGTGQYTTGITAGPLPQSAISAGLQAMSRPSSLQIPQGPPTSGGQAAGLGGQYGDLMRQMQAAGGVGLQRQIAPQQAQLGLQSQEANAQAGLQQQGLLTGLQAANFQATLPYQSFLYNMLGQSLNGSLGNSGIASGF